MARRVSFPLPENYFPPVELTERDEEQFQAWAHALVQETLEGFTKDQYMTREQRERKWKPLKQRGELTVYRRRSGTEEEGDEYRYLCTGTTPGTLDEVLLGRYADSTDSFRRMSAVYREDLVDCVVLHTIATQSASEPFFFSGFKWMTVKSPGKGLVKNRDVCWFEQSGLTRDHKGKEIGYHIAQSVDLAACPPFDESVCVRARLSACYLFRRNKSGGVKVFMRGKNNAGGKVLDWVADMKSAELWLRAERAAAATQALVATEMVRAALPPSGAATHLLGSNNRCEVCAEKTAGVMVSQKECAVCRRVTCSRCVVKRRVLSSARDFLADQRELFCKRCVRFFNEIRHRDPQSIAMACAAAAARAEPHGSGSFDRRGFSHCSSHSSDSDGGHWSHSSGSSLDRAMTQSQRSAGGSYVPPSPGSMKRLARQDSQRSVGSHHSAPVVLYPEMEMMRGKPSTASSASNSSRGRAPLQPASNTGVPPSKTISVRRIADSDASTVASSVHSSAFRPNGYNTSHSSFASEYSYTDSTSSAGEYSMYRDTTDSSPHQSFQKHSVGSYAGYPPSHNQGQHQYQGQYGYGGHHGARLGSTDELPSPMEVAPPRSAKQSSRTKSGYSTPEDMMQQMIRMNIMAEQARQMVKDNDKFTRKFNFY